MAHRGVWAIVIFRNAWPSTAAMVGVGGVGVGVVVGAARVGCWMGGR